MSESASTGTIQPGADSACRAPSAAGSFRDHTYKIRPAPKQPHAPTARLSLEPLAKPGAETLVYFTYTRFLRPTHSAATFAEQLLDPPPQPIAAVEAAAHAPNANVRSPCRVIIVPLPPATSGSTIL